MITTPQMCKFAQVFVAFMACIAIANAYDSLAESNVLDIEDPRTQKILEDGLRIIHFKEGVKTILKGFRMNINDGGTRYSFTYISGRGRLCYCNIYDVEDKRIYNTCAKEDESPIVPTTTEYAPEEPEEYDDYAYE